MDRQFPAMAPTPSESEAEAALDAAVVPTPGRRLRVMTGLIVLLLLMGALLAIASDKLLFERVVSASMEPTLRVGDVLLVDANRFPDRYDIVCVRNPQRPSETLVKRVIGLPGDRIRLSGGILYLNEVEEYSPYVSENRIHWRDLALTVPEDTLFVLGDNRNNSYDSLNFGPVPFDHLLGTVRWIVRPLSRFGRPQALHEPSRASH